ncbi:MAG: MBL fold metallo-hydrolase [Deltaproteobacteria bacterium]|nr:MBL fold metallo-hydrolase [Nannocystaceae bacterium]
MIEGEDELRVGGLTLRGVTRGGIQTCVMVPELDLMFDVGGSVRGQQRFSTILVSHGHQDHLGGLPYLISQRGLSGLPGPAVHVPVEIAVPLTRIFESWSEIEGFALQVGLHGHAPGEVVELGASTAATCVRSVHRVPSLAWIVERTSGRLKAEFVGREGAELAELRRAGVHVTEPYVADVLCVTGDTQIELWDREPRVRTSKVLVHEITAWDQRRTVEETRAWGHTHVDELIERAEQFEGEALVLVHRSPRHTRAEAEQVIATRFPASVRDRIHVFGR